MIQRGNADDDTSSKGKGKKAKVKTAKAAAGGDDSGDGDNEDGSETKPSNVAGSRKARVRPTGRPQAADVLDDIAGPLTNPFGRRREPNQFSDLGKVDRPIDLASEDLSDAGTLVPETPGTLPSLVGAPLPQLGAAPAARDPASAFASLTDQPTPEQVPPPPPRPADLTPPTQEDPATPVVKAAIASQQQAEAQAAPVQSTSDPAQAQISAPTGAQYDAMGNVTSPAPTDPEVAERQFTDDMSGMLQRHPTTIDYLKSANTGLIKIPRVDLPRLAAFMYKPIDAALGTNLFERTQRSLDQTEQYIDQLGLTKNAAERAASTTGERVFEALGSAILPLPVKAPAVGVGPTIKQLSGELLLPGALIRPGQSVAGGMALSGGINVAASQSFEEFMKKDLEVAPKTKEPTGDEVPAVVSVDPVEGQKLQDKIDLSKMKNIATIQAGWSLPDWAVAGAAAGGAYLLGRRFVGGLARDVPNRLLVDANAPSLATRAQRPVSETTATEIARTIGEDDKYVLESQLNKMGRPDLVDNLLTSSGPALNARVQHTINTGEVATPGHTSDLSVSPRAVMENHIQRPTHEREEFERALAIMDDVDNAALQLRPMPPQQDINWAQAVLARPDNVGPHAALREMTDTALDVSVASGRITQAEAQRLRQIHPNYIHRVPLDDIVDNAGTARNMTVWEQWQQINRNADAHWNTAGAPDDLPQLMARAPSSGDAQIYSPVLASVRSFEDTLKFAYNNDNRRQFIEAALADPVYQDTLRPHNGTLLNDPRQAVVHYWENGAQRSYATEAMVANALRFAPQEANKIWTLPKKIMQFGTTAAGAPWFGAINNFWYDAFVSATTRARGLQLGYIDQAVRWASGDRFGVPGDTLGTFAAMVPAALRGMQAQHAMEMAAHVEAAMLQNPAIRTDEVVQLFGDSFVKRIARGYSIGAQQTAQGVVDAARNVYSDSARGWGTRTGALHSSMHEYIRDVTGSGTSVISDTLKREFGDSLGGRAFDYYSHALEQVFEASRLRGIEQNVRQVQQGTLRESRLAREIREFTGDPTRRGTLDFHKGFSASEDTNATTTLALGALKKSSPLLQGFSILMQNAPFSQAITQGWRRMAESLLDPRQSATTIAGIVNGYMIPTVTLSLLPALAYDAMNTDPAKAGQYIKHLFDGREEWKKATRIYFPLPGKRPEDGIELPVPAEGAMFTHPVLAVLDSLFNFTGHYSADQTAAQKAEHMSVGEALLNGLTETFNFPLPIYGQAGLALSGSSKRGVWDNLVQRRPETASGTQAGFHTASQLGTSAELLMNTLFGTIGGMGINVFNAGASALKSKTASSVVGPMAQQAVEEIRTRIPGVAYPRYSETGSTLADHIRDKVDALHKIAKLDQVYQRYGAMRKQMPAGTELPNIQMGYPGVVPDDPAFNQIAPQVLKMMKGKGEIASLLSERSIVSQQLAGIRGMNMGNIRDMRVIPLAKPMGEMTYAIVADDTIRRREKAEEAPVEMTKGNKKEAPRPKKNQSIPRSLEDVFGEGATSIKPEDYPNPTMAQRQELANQLNKYRYRLDLRTAEAVASIERGDPAKGVPPFDIVKFSKSFKLDRSTEFDPTYSSEQ